VTLPPSDLTSLVERVEGASGADREIDRQLAVAIDGFWIEHQEYRGARYCHLDKDGRVSMPGQAGDMLVPAYTASVDAALALVERVLPGAYWRLEALPPALQEAYGAPFWASCGLPGEQEDAWGQEAASTLCAALLRALTVGAPT